MTNSKYYLYSLIIIFVFFLGSIIWAAFFQLASGISFSGFTKNSSDIVEIRNLVDGEVENIFVSPGDKVTKGQILVEIKNNKLRDHIDKLINTKSILLTQKELLIDQNQILQKRLSIIEETNKNLLKLLKKGVITKIEKDNSDLKLLAAENVLNEGKQALTDIELKIIEIETETKVARIQMKDYDVRSPMQGTVLSSIDTAPGARVFHEQQLFEIVPSGEKLIIEANLPADFRDRVNEGDEIFIMFPSVDVNRSSRYPALVTFISADKSSNSSKNTDKAFFKLRASFSNKDIGFNIQSGIPVMLITNNASRTLLDFIIEPVLANFNRGLRG